MKENKSNREEKHKDIFDAHHLNSSRQLDRSIQIPIRNLENGRHLIEIVCDAEFLDIPQFHQNLRIEGTLTKQNDRIVLDLILFAHGHFECSRCADPFHRVLKTALRIEFVPSTLATDEQDDNIHVYDPVAKPALDITEDVHDALILAIPMKNLCRPDCKGICAGCGKDLNRESCVCEVIQENSNWSALKAVQERLRAEESKKGGPA